MKKFIAILLVCTMIFTLCACGEKKKSTGEEIEKVEFLNEDIEIGKDPTPVDLEKDYKIITYVPQMFYGRYQTDDYITVKSVKEGVKYNHPEKGEITLGYLPVGLEAGPVSLRDDISFCEDYHVAKLSYHTNTSRIDLFAAFEVKDKKITFTIIDSYEFDPITLDVDVKLSDVKFEYSFSFEGNTITLTDGTNTAILEDETRLGAFKSIWGVEGYIDDDSPDMPTDDMYAIDCTKFEPINGSKGMLGNKADAESKLPVSRQEYEPVSVEMYSDGLFRIARIDAKTGKVVTDEYIAFVCGYDGLVLCKGLKTYCYTKSYKQIAIEELSANLEPENIAVLKQMEANDLADIVETRNKLFAELETELGKQGVKAAVNRRNGEIALDSTVLFATGESTLSGEGKAFLKKFVTAYSSVVLKEEYNGFLSKVMIEGHTDSTGTDEVNKPLSKARADAVLEYCTSAESGLTAAQIGTIKNLLGTFGYASERPVLKADGTEDADASRRVGFRFIINIDTSKIESTTEA